MKDLKLTEIMLKSLKKDPSLCSYNEWNNAGDFAVEMRFFPHAFHCYQNAFNLDKNPQIAEKLNTVLDKITNVLEIVPDDIKSMIEDVRLNNPLDPVKWLQISNSLLKGKVSDDFFSAKLSLALCSYCSLRSGFDVEPINSLLSDLIDLPDLSDFQSCSLEISNSDAPLKVVALGDNVTLGLQSDWEIKFNETYHYLWSKDCRSQRPVNIANCGVSGAGALDALLYLGRDVVNYKPDLVFINFGINDAWLGYQALPAYETLLESVIKLLEPKHKIVLITPIPHIPEACPENQRPTKVDLREVEIDEWVNACKRVAIRTGVPLANAFAEFPSSKEQRKKYLANGFNQPNLAGHGLIKEAIDKVLKLV